MNTTNHTPEERERYAFLAGDEATRQIAQSLAGLEEENDRLCADAATERQEAFAAGKAEGLGPLATCELAEALTAVANLEIQLKVATRILGFAHLHITSDLCKTGAGRKQLSQAVQQNMVSAGLGWPQHSHH